jgi:hypothetical protein
MKKQQKAVRNLRLSRETLANLGGGHGQVIELTGVDKASCTIGRGCRCVAEG